MTESSAQPKKRTMFVTPHTKSFKALLPYTIPYALAYSLLPLGLEKINFPLGGLLLTGFVVLLIGILLILVFKAVQKRLLEKIECSRIGILTTCITTIVSTVLFVTNLGTILPSDITMGTLYEQGMIMFFLIPFLITLFINYAVSCYSLWFLQKLWRPKL